jgi:serine protease
VYNNAWVSQNRVLENTVNPISEKDLYGKFNDSNAATPLEAVVDHRFFAWSTPGDDKYVIVEYKFHNTSATTWTNFYVGLFADWDIQTYANNKCDEVPALKLGYSYHTAVNGLYGGMKVLSHTPFNHYGLDNIAGGGGGIDIGDTDGYSLVDKYATLSTGRATAGTATANGGDVHDVVSTGPFTVAAGDSVTVAFALLGGDNLADISQSATNAQIKYDGVILPTKKVQNKTFLAQNIPNPVSSRTQIVLDLPESGDITLTLNDITGKELQNIYTGKAAEGTHTYDLDLSTLPNGTYVYTLTSGSETFSQRLVVLH